MTSRPSDRELRWLNDSRIRVRQVDELIGLAKGVVADGALNNEELAYLVNWLVVNRDLTDEPVVGRLYSRIESMFADNVFDDDERAELLDALKSFGSEPIESGEVMKSTALPFADPAPPLGFAGWRYCFTGTFGYGTRPECEAAVTRLGALAGTLTKQTDTLVVGEYATESWLHSSYGRKIMKAVEMQQDGHHIVIVPERHWLSHI